MPIPYPNLDLLEADDFADCSRWHHEGIGLMEALPGGILRLHCNGSRQGGPGCMAFFRPTLPDAIAIEYTITIRRQGGLVINYLAIRGLNGEDLIEDRARLEPRDGQMKCYYARKWGLQSYHVSFSRFNDLGEHTATSNWRRNPGSRLIGHGLDPCTALNRPYRIRLTKDAGHAQLFVDDQFAHAFIDRDESRYPIPDTGKFGFRLIGSDALAEIGHFRVYRIAPDPGIRKHHEDAV